MAGGGVGGERGVFRESGVAAAVISSSTLCPLEMVLAPDVQPCTIDPPQALLFQIWYTGVPAPEEIDVAMEQVSPDTATQFEGVSAEAVAA